MRRGVVAGGLAIPDGYGNTLAAGDTATVEVLADPASGLPGALAAAVRPVVETDNARLAAARFARPQTGVDAGTAEAAAAQVDVAPALAVDAQAAGPAAEVAYADTAPSRNLVLFVFISSLVAASRWSTAAASASPSAPWPRRQARARSCSAKPPAGS